MDTIPQLTELAYDGLDDTGTQRRRYNVRPDELCAFIFAA